MTTQPEFHGVKPDAGLFDLSTWPIVFVRFPELNEERRSERVLDGLDRLIDQERRFVVIWVPPSHAHESEPHADERRASLWIKRRRDDLGRHCAGYIYLTSEPALRSKLTKTFPKTDKIFPFPKFLVESRQEAAERARKLLSGEEEGNS